MKGLKDFWEYFTNWFMNSVIRMSTATKAIVLPILMIGAFGAWAYALKLTKKDLKGFPFLLYILGGLIFALAIWIIVES